MTEHAFTVRDVQNGNPVLCCANTGCRVVWWPNRNRPKSKCAGQRKPVSDAALLGWILGGGLR